MGSSWSPLTKLKMQPLFD
ncbi:hypothetical protein R3I94_008069 [Phoxinus phoxinus]